MLNLNDLNISLTNAVQRLLSDQRSDGHWCYELEADCTTSSEYVIMTHYLDELDPILERKIAVYLRTHQNDDGGWPLFYGGDADLSCSIKAYYALKLIGDDINAQHMILARECILKLGGAAKANVFTRITLALFQQLPWRGVPFIPVEIMLLPKWFPFHLNKVSYWSRTVMVPLFVLCTLKIPAKNPRNINVQELFVVDANKEQNYYQINSILNRFFLLLDKLGRYLKIFIPKSLTEKAFKKAEQWVIARLNGEDGLGAILPAMIGAYEILRLRNYAYDHIYCVQARLAFKKLLIINENSAYCQPCLSPVWDTGLSILTLHEESAINNKLFYTTALSWLSERQILSGDADWREYNPTLPPGGWAFEYNNAFYPDLDDTALIGWVMCLVDKKIYHESITYAANWLAGMQSKNGGFASFDKNNTYFYLNAVPFADHGALLDPPTADVTARCLTFFAKLDRPQDKLIIKRGLDFLLKEQEPDGSWFGRWGTNYIYGTWAVLVALNMAGLNQEHIAVKKAVNWLLQRQHTDGGFGESNASYFNKEVFQSSTAYQTAWALLGLMSAGEVENIAVQRGIQFLLKMQQEDGFWHEPWHTAPGFPRVFYLRYHGYSKYFPIWAIAQYRKLIYE